MGVEFVTYGGEPPPGCPTAMWDDLCTVGLPRIVVNIFTPALGPIPVSADLDDIRVHGIVLGYGRGNHELYLDFESGSVYTPWPPESSHDVVSSFLAAFRESLLQVDARYRFYPSDADLDMAWAAEEELRRILVGIDAVSTADPDGYWSSFLDDVAVGDYAAHAEQERPTE